MARWSLKFFLPVSILACSSYPVVQLVYSALLPGMHSVYGLRRCIRIVLSDSTQARPGFFGLYVYPHLPKPWVTRSRLHTKPSTRMTHIFREQSDVPRSSCLGVGYCPKPGWLAGWLAGWMVGWIVGWMMVGYLNSFPRCSLPVYSVHLVVAWFSQTDPGPDGGPDPKTRGPKCNPPRFGPRVLSLSMQGQAELRRALVRRLTWSSAGAIQAAGC